jgi:hypothetical protein
VKIEITPDTLARLRRYAEAFRAHPHPIFAHFPGESDPVFPFAPGSDRGLGVLLLTASLHQPGAESIGARLLAGLYRAHGNDIFRLNRLPFEPLRDEVAALAPTWEEAARARIPGILRSVCDFFFRIGPLGPWLAGQSGELAPDWEARAGELCHEVYWMGAHSRGRTKARLFFWLACAAGGEKKEGEEKEGTFGARYPQAASFGWPVGEGHMRFWIDILKPARTAGERTPEERVAAFAAFARTVFPGEPWLLYRPLEDFLRRDGTGSFHCRTAQGGCRPCPLSTLCPAAGHFIPGEG